MRRARREDAPAVAELALRLFAQHRDYDARRFAEIASIEGAERFYGSQTNANDAAVLVAELDEKVVGFAYIQFEALNYAALLENAAWLHDLYIDEAARGQNAGKSLIKAAVETAKELGADKLLLSVAAQNQIAQKTFERAGFRTTMVEMFLDLTETENNDGE